MALTGLKLGLVREERIVNEGTNEVIFAAIGRSGYIVQISDLELWQ